MELRHLRYFLEVAEAKSFTKAAEKLLIAQPPLSRQIKDLEDELGTALFERTNKGVILTEAGEKFKEYALQILQLSEQSIEVVKDMNRGLQGTLYIASVEGQAPHLISKWIAEFHKKYPQVEYNLWNGNSDDVLNRLKNGLCDIAVIVGPYNQESLQGICVYEEPWVAMIPVDHILAKSEDDEIELMKLAPYDLIIPSRHSRLQEITDWFAINGVKPKIICRMAHVLNAHELTEQNVGIAIYPASVQNYADSNKIVIKKIKNPDVTASYFMTKTAERKLSILANAFWKSVENTSIC